MRPDSYAVRYQPTSPLSPRMADVHAHLSPQSARGRPTPSKSSLRPFGLDMPSYASYGSRSQGVSPPSGSQSPAITLNRGTQPSPMESPRLMREKQKELIARAQLSSKLAASAMAAKPEAPRLDPLGSPKGPVTPLLLEEQGTVDYFTVTGGGRLSPVPSSNGRSSRSSVSSLKEEKSKKKYKIELYQ